MEVKTSAKVENLPDDLTADQLKGLKISEMRKLAEAAGISAKGPKSKLLERISKAINLRDSLRSMDDDESEEPEEEPEEAEAMDEEPADDEEEADEEDATFTVGENFIEGTVHQWKGNYGFINIGGKAPLFCHNGEINSSDRFPCLRKNMEVRLKLATWTSGDKNGQTFAKEVQARDGSDISYFEKQGESDHWDRVDIESPEDRYNGTVLWYNFRKKFGLIKPDEPISFGEGDDKVEISDKAEEGKDSVYVGWHDILTDDDPPGLVKDMKVQFSLYKDGQGFGAANVALVGGGMIVRPDARNKKWKPDTEARFTGTVKYFKVNGFGFITPNEKQADGEDFPYNEQIFKERLYVNPYDINTDASPAFLKEDQEVEFSVDVGNGQLHAKNITGADGGSLPGAEEGELPDAYKEKVKRESLSEEVFTGKVKFFAWDKHFGTIEMEEDNMEGLDDKTKKAITEKSVYVNWSDIQSTDKVIGVEAETEVQFKLYKDEKGIGAEEVTDMDGEPLSGQVKPAPKRKSWRNFRGRGRGRWRGRGRGRWRGRGRGRGRRYGRGRGRGRGRRGGWRGRKRNYDGGYSGGQAKRRRVVGWDDVGSAAKGGSRQGFVQWWDKSQGEGCIVAGSQRFKATKDQLQAEKPQWAFLEKDQMIEFQAGKDRFGHDCCFYVTGPGGSLIRQLTTLGDTQGPPQMGSVPPTQGGGGGRFLSTGPSRWSGMGGRRSGW